MRYKDFVYTKICPIEELNCKLVELTHEPTGASVVHIQNDDTENTFCLSFRTYPYSSNGAAHILEHTVLCGSKRFPIKDPFFSMNRRSLNTFMNAFTGNDFTCYPASSQVEKDFYNLLDVYLDSVFHPILKRESFLQEGWRFEFKEKDDPNSHLLYKGIVFNEMKGNYASPESRLGHTLLKELLPDLPYSYDAGGDPKEIPHLTYDELLHFHQKYYHPSHCLFYFYGNIPIEKHLDFISEKIPFKAFKKAPPLPKFPTQKRFSKPLFSETFYPMQGEDLTQKTFISFGWLTTDIQNQHDLYALILLDSILMDTDASPLRHKLISSGLCTQAESLLDVEMSEIPYFITCKGCQRENADALKKVLQDSLEEIAEKGINERHVKASLHQLELSRKELTGNGYPYGLSLFMRCALAKQHGADIENALRINKHLDFLLKAAKDPHFLPNIIKKYLIDNTHAIQNVMSPDPLLEKKELEEEGNSLKEIRMRLMEKEKEIIIAESHALLNYQIECETQSLDCLPKLEVSEIPKETKDFRLTQKKEHDLVIYRHDVFTNHMLYVDYLFDLEEITQENLPFAQLFTSLLPHLGMGGRGYMENLQLIQETAGGLNTYIDLHLQMGNPLAANPCFGCRGKALLKNREKLFTLIRDLLLSPNFEEENRIVELLAQIAINLQNRLNQKALGYAIQLALAGYSTASYMQYVWSGLKYYQFIMDLMKDLKSALPLLINKLKEMQNTLFHFHKPHLIITGPSEMEEHHILHSPKGSFSPWKGEYEIQRIPSQARPISSPVAFTCLGYKTIACPHNHSPALCLATYLFEHLALHPKIREQGGAYGSGASYSPVSGNIYFYSYRDPYIGSSVFAFHEAIKRIGSGKFIQSDIEEAKLTLFQSTDSPITPGSRGITAYNWLREGKTKEKRQEFREAILALKKSDIKEAVQEHLLPMIEKGTLVTFAGKDLIESENKILEKKGFMLPIIPI